MFGYTLGFTSPALSGMMNYGKTEHKFLVKPTIFPKLDCTCDNTKDLPPGLGQTCTDEHGGKLFLLLFTVPDFQRTRLQTGIPSWRSQVCRIAPSGRRMHAIQPCPLILAARLSADVPLQFLQQLLNAPLTRSRKTLRNTGLS